MKQKGRVMVIRTIVGALILMGCGIYIASASELESSILDSGTVLEQESPGPGIISASVIDSSLSLAKMVKEIRDERLRQNKEELRQLRIMDSVGWIKSTAIRRSDRSMDDLERERQQRKINALMGLCNQAKFTSLAEVDSLGGMKPDEKAFCKERLKTTDFTK
jgi:hypothetical protein